MGCYDPCSRPYVIHELFPDDLLIHDTSSGVVPDSSGLSYTSFLPLLSGGPPFQGSDSGTVRVDYLDDQVPVGPPFLSSHVGASVSTRLVVLTLRHLPRPSGTPRPGSSLPWSKQNTLFLPDVVHPLRPRPLFLSGLPYVTQTDVHRPGLTVTKFFIQMESASSNSTFHGRRGGPVFPDRSKDKAPEGSRPEEDPPIRRGWGNLSVSVYRCRSTFPTTLSLDGPVGPRLSLKQQSLPLSLRQLPVDSLRHSTRD